MHVTIGDARETLLTTRERYDIIVSEPSNPYRAGIASLFTVEFYRAAARPADRRRRLRAVGAGLRDRRAHAAHDLRDAGGGVSARRDVADQQRRPGAAGVAASSSLLGRSRSARESPKQPYKDALASVWRAVDLHGLLAHYLATDAVTRAFATRRPRQINTDDRNVVEFGLARSVGRATPNLVEELRGLARGDGRLAPAAR